MKKAYPVKMSLFSFPGGSVVIVREAGGLFKLTVGTIYLIKSSDQLGKTEAYQVYPLPQHGRADYTVSKTLTRFNLAEGMVLVDYLGQEEEIGLGDGKKLINIV